MIRITELSLPLDHREDALRKAIVRRLGVPDADLLDFTVFKRSYDARKKSSTIAFVYIVDVQVRGEAALLGRLARDPHVRPAPDMSYRPVGRAPANLSVVRVADEIVVDLLLSAGGIRFAEAQSEVSIVEVAGVPIPFASPRLLMRMKQTGREKATLDLLFLRELLSHSRPD